MIPALLNGSTSIQNPLICESRTNGLAHLVEGSGLSLYDPALYLFTNKQKCLVKSIYWAQTGFCLWMMRLEEKKFPWPKKLDSQFEITSEQFNWLIQGVDFMKITAHEPLAYQRFS